MKVFINGVQQTQSGGNGGAGQFSNTTDGLTIGKRGPTVPYQFYDGKITNVRISTTALYSSDFIPALLPTRNISTTALLWTPTDQSITTDTGDNALSITNNNSVSYSSDYPTQYTVTTAHALNPGWTNDTYGPATLFMANPFYPDNTKPAAGWSVTDGTNIRTITGIVSRSGSGYGQILIVNLNSAVNFNAASTVTLTD
jgi:hypothetical protein